MAFGPLNTLRFLMRHPLTADRPAQALVRYLRWQVGSRIGPGPVAVAFVNDARLLVRRGMTGATGNIYTGLHEFEDMAFLLHALRAEDLFVDVGANIGSYTVLAAKVVGARVIAFEPIGSTFASLRDNIALNDVGGRVEALAACVGSSAGTVRMSANLDTVNHVLTPGASAPEAGVEVPVVSLDEQLAGRAPFLMKIDVEGYELEVLKGAARTLANPALHAVIMEINASGERYGRGDAELEAVMREHGFGAHRYEPFERRLASQLPGQHSGANTIFVRQPDVVRGRLRSAPAFRVGDRTL